MALDSLEREARERKKKMLALSSLPLCVGFFVWRLQSTTTAAPPPKPPAPSVTAKAAPVVAAAVGPTLSLEKARVVEVPTLTRDPFMPMVAISLGNETPNVLAKPSAVAVTETPPIKMPGAVLPFVQPTLKFFGPVKTVQPTEPAPGTPGAQATPAVPVAPVAPAAPVMPYVLTGVVKGYPDVAILRHIGDGSRRIARVGDALDRKYRLITIEENSVVIEGAGETKTLRLGGDVPAVAAPAAKK